jgi:hypothetical protein
MHCRENTSTCNTRKIGGLNSFENVSWFCKEMSKKLDIMSFKNLQHHNIDKNNIKSVKMSKGLPLKVARTPSFLLSLSAITKLAKTLIQGVSEGMGVGMGHKGRGKGVFIG